MGLKVFGATLITMLIAGLAIAKEEKSMKGSVSKNVQIRTEDKTVEPLFSGPFKVMGIGLSKGQKLEKHQTPSAAFLYVDSGRVVFRMNGEKINLEAGDYFVIPPKEMHEVQADEDSRLILIK